MLCRHIFLFVVLSFVPSHAVLVQDTSVDLFAATTTDPQAQTNHQDGSSLTIANAVVAISLVTEGTTLLNDNTAMGTLTTTTEAKTTTATTTTSSTTTTTTPPTTSHAVFALKQIATTASEQVVATTTTTTTTAPTSSAPLIEQATKPPTTATTEPLVTSAQIVLSTDTSTTTATTSLAPSNAPVATLSTCTTDSQCTSLALREIATLQIQSSPLYAAVVAASQEYNACSRQDESCQFSALPRINSAISAFVSNSDERIIKLETIVLSWCNQNTLCIETVRRISKDIQSLLKGLVVACSEPICKSVMSERFTAPSLSAIASCSSVDQCAADFNNHGALFKTVLGPAKMQSEVIQRTVEVRTIDASSSTWPDVRGANVRLSFFVMGLNLGLEMTDKDEQTVFRLVHDFQQCNSNPCPSDQWVVLKNNITAANVVLNLWHQHLKEVKCSTSSCASMLNQKLAAAARLVAATSNTITPSVALSGIAVDSILALCAITLLAFSITLKSAIMLNIRYTILTAFVLLSLTLRIVFWVVGYLGYGSQMGATYDEITFFVLDKVSSLLFVLCMLFFLYMWACAIHNDVLQQPKLNAFAKWFCIGAATLLTISTVVLTIVYARSFSLVSQALGDWKVDYSSLILAAALFLIGVALLTYIIVALRSITKNKGNAQPHKQVIYARLMTAFVAVLVAAFLCRLIVVYLQRLLPGTNFGDNTFYGVGTLLTESLACALILVVASIFTFNAKMAYMRMTDKQSLSDSLLDDEDQPESQPAGRYLDL